MSGRGFLAFGKWGGTAVASLGIVLTVALSARRFGAMMAYPLHRSTPAEGAAFGVPASPDLPALERDILAYWASDGTFQASIEARDPGREGANEFVFYDGPPFANGLPHYGHLLTGYVKDVVPRYMTMRGHRVERRFGWDTHGLPAELEAERVLGITDKSQIETMGIGAFNAACRESVLRYTAEWEEYVTRQARWVDFDQDYKTLDVTFMESVLWAFKELYDQGLAYEGYRVLPYCWRDETPLSNHELRMDDDVYASRQDPALTVGLRVTVSALNAVQPGDLLLIWTTTPWTLPSNLAVAVGPEIEYAIVQAGAESPLAGHRVVLGAARVAAYTKELGEDATVLATVTGADLAGLRYAPPFDYFTTADTYPVDSLPQVHQALAADFVSTDDGTGIVHLAPGFGEDDLAVCAAAGIDVVVPLDSRGQFTHQVPDYVGQQVFDANPMIIKDLKNATGPVAAMAAERRAIVVRHETYQHSYPHCWRCRNPLIYRGVSSWFIKVSAIRDRMVELNQEISWTPDHIGEGQFGKWLAGARDWSISRNRYWGSPIPVWVSDNPEYPRIDVYGSLAQLEADFGRLPRNTEGEIDLHRPYIDELTRPNPDDPTGQSTMRRIADVFDVWFDSGSMPFAQVHYPFANTEWFEHHFPGDFIVEYIGQTRGWFYVLHVLSTALFDRPAFRSAVSHGIVLGDDGRKMSKSLRNYPDVQEVFDRDGSDAMRWFLVSSPILRGGNLIVTEEGIRDSVRQVLLPLWSTYYFFTLYANAANGGAGITAQNVGSIHTSGLLDMDRYILARTHQLVATTTEQLDRFDVAAACEAIRDHLDVLTNWYVRTQRDRFWHEDQAAFDTLYTALEVLTRVMAPLAPLVTEEIWRGLTGGRSVHLESWPQVSTDQYDDALVQAMDQVRAVVSTALSVRKAHSVRVRQPLSVLTVAVPDPQLLVPYQELIAREFNVKHIDMISTHDEAAHRFGVSERLTVNPRALGPRLGRGVQAVILAAKAGDWSVSDDQLTVHTAAGPVVLHPGEYEMATVVSPSDDAGQVAAAVLPSGGFVALNLELSDQLRAEGYARDVIREVQDTRKAVGLDISDRIELTLTIPDAWLSAVQAYESLIATETLAVLLSVTPGPDRSVSVKAVN